MDNRIRKTTWEVRRLSAVEAEVWLHIEVDQATPAMELRGRLHGPRCPGVTTVEVAYPLRSLAQNGNTFTARVLIPEPNLWTERMPFVYEGTVELWEADRCHDRESVSLGLKSA